METAKTRPLAKSFEDWVVWQKAHQSVLQVDAMTETFPKADMFDLTSQLRRAAVLIAANIAEGFRMQSKRYIGQQFCEAHEKPGARI